MRSLLFLLLLSGSAQAQLTLKPRVYVNDIDTAYCFNKMKAIEIAKLITIGEYDQQHIKLLKRTIDSLRFQVRDTRKIVSLREQKIDLLEQKVKDRNELINRQDKFSSLQQTRIDALEGEVRRQKRLKKWMIGLGLAGISGAIIAF